jgi:4-hydroxysphinganine ceramide fatty acyl 2-hydroxylase
MATRTVWYVVPIFWAPIAIYLFLRSVFQFTGPLPGFFSNPTLPLSQLSKVPTDSFVKTGLCFLAGNIIWTMLEYGMHRFLFHIDDYLPDKPAFLTLHFLMHGIHHYLPMDRCVVMFWFALASLGLTYFLPHSLRLVMPPTLFTALQFPFTQLAYVIFPVSVSNGIISGAFTFCEFVHRFQ